MKNVWVYVIEIRVPGRADIEIDRKATRIGTARRIARQETVAGFKKATIWHLLKGGGREMIARYERGEEV